MVLALSALSEPTRQRILEMLAPGPLSSGDIARRLAASPPAISQHLRTLRLARLVHVRADAQRRIYELDPAGVGELSAWIGRLQAFWADKLDTLEEELRK
jgi:DNA-binding transcriptional ArsR family regulator